MRRPFQIILIMALVALFGFGSGAWFASSPRPPAQAATGNRILYYRDPMHPAYRSDKPGVAPDCGMELEPVYAEAADQPAIPGSIRVSRGEQQLIGIRTVPVERSGGSQMLRTAGRVSADETRVYRLTSAVDGWILKTYPKVIGDPVKKGERLLTFYSRDFLGAQQAYFYSVDSLQRLEQMGPVTPQQRATTLAQIQQNKETLLTLGMGDAQIAEIGTDQKLTQEVFLNSPIDGVVLARNFSPGLRFDRGLEFYRIADLDHIWIYAEIFENESKYLRPGATAAVLWQGRTFQARMASSPPQFDAASRTLRVRLEADNPGAVLRPDMFVDVEIPLHLPEALTVPANAVLDSGRHKIVYLDQGDGVFEPRAVETSWHFGDRIAVTRGLAPGDRVVASGNFLLDSESRLQLAAAGSSPLAGNHDPVCGMTVKSDRYSFQFAGRTWRFCSETCLRDFAVHPEKYAGGAR